MSKLGFAICIHNVAGLIYKSKYMKKASASRSRIMKNIRSTLQILGEDTDREGLKETPQRYAKAMEFLTSGYGKNVDQIVGNAIFNETSSEIVVVRDIELF